MAPSFFRVLLWYWFLAQFSTIILTLPFQKSFSEIQSGFINFTNTNKNYYLSNNGEESDNSESNHIGSFIGFAG